MSPLRAGLPRVDELLLTPMQQGENDIWMIGANGGKPVRMTTDPANDGDPSWSRDGRWIYFDSARTGEQQVWKIPADGGEAIQVTSGRWLRAA